MSAMPALTPLTTPAFDTVATLGSDDCHVAFAVTV
jgi:hypothetical protein